MSANMQCPNCSAILVEYGETDKGDAHSFYRVYDSVENEAEDAGAKRVLECLVCEHFIPIEKWQR